MFTVPLDGSATAERARAYGSRSGASPRNTVGCRVIETDGDFSAKKALISIR